MVNNLLQSNPLMIIECQGGFTKEIGRLGITEISKRTWWSECMCASLFLSEAPKMTVQKFQRHNFIRTKTMRQDHRRIVNKFLETVNMNG